MQKRPDDVRGSQPFFQRTPMQMILKLHSLAQRAHGMKCAPIARCLEGAIRIVFGAVLPSEARIGNDVFFEHSGLGVVLNKLSVIEDHCRIGVHVVLGGRAPVRGAPHLEQGVIVHAGAKLIGPIRVGAGAVVAANAVVIADVPPGCLVAGVPAIIKRRDILSESYRPGAPTVGAVVEEGAISALRVGRQ